MTDNALGPSGYLASRFRRHELNIEAEHAVTIAIRKAQAEAPPHPNAYLPGDPWKLRGIPVVGVHGGIGGAIRETQPETELLRSDR